MPKAPSVVIYARESTDPEDKQVPLIESQVQELRALAARRSIEVDFEYRECGSAKTPDRALFDWILWKTKAGQISTILCWRLDRLVQNSIDAIALLRQFGKHRFVRIITPECSFEGEAGRLFLAIHLVAWTKRIDIPALQGAERS